MKPLLIVTGLCLLFLAVQPSPGLADEATSGPSRYRDYEMSSGSYDEYEVRPQQYRSFVVEPEEGEYSRSAATVRNRSRLSDSHLGLEFYAGRKCEDCHKAQARSLHTVRNKITCRQCHGGEPIASIKHYYSPLNPLRRHAYVCAKCHEGANMSFAAYQNHEPRPWLLEARVSFPALFWGFWIMVGIAIATFVLFLPHTALWGVRELFVRRHREKGKEEES